MSLRFSFLGLMLWPLLSIGQSKPPIQPAQSKYSMSYLIGLNRYYLDQIENDLYQGPDLQLSHSFDFRFGRKYFLGFRFGYCDATLSLAKYQDSTLNDPNCEMIQSKQLQVYDFGLSLGYKRDFASRSTLAMAIGFDFGTFSAATSQIETGFIACDSLPFGGPDRRRYNSPFRQKPRSYFLMVEYHHRLKYNIHILARLEAIWRVEVDNFNFPKHSFRPVGALGIGYSF